MGVVYLCSPVYRSLDVRTAVAIQAALGAAPPGESVFWEPLWGDALVARSRSVLATKFLTEHPEADCAVMVDDDIVFLAADFWKIVAGCRETHSIYAGVYVTHGDKPHLTSRLLPGTPDLDIRASTTRSPREVEYSATGFCAFHRDVIQAMADGQYEDADGMHRLHLCVRGAELMPQGFYPFFDTMTIEEAPGVFHWLSEDWAFCERARQLGLRVWVDQSIVLHHMGTHDQSIEDMQGLAVGTERLLVSLPQTGDPLIDDLPADLSEFTGQPIEQTMGAIQEGTAVLARLWGERGATSESDWYKLPQVGVGYALDLAQWHMRGGGVPLDYALDLAGKRVLDYGSGIGTFALAAARAGAIVKTAEINPWLVDFTYFRSQKLGLELHDENPPFDVIVLWHVAEHVPDPGGLLDHLLSLLSPDGILISQSDFHIDSAHPMHHDYPGGDSGWEALLLFHGLTSSPSSPNVYHRVRVTA